MALTKKQETIIKKWVAALRSGKYKQGKNFLRKKSKGVERYCCLGVLCELAVKAKVIERPVLSHTTYFYENDKEILPRKIQEWAGLREDDGGYSQLRSLTVLNDNGSKFTTIADIIESKPEGLFV